VGAKDLGRAEASERTRVHPGKTLGRIRSLWEPAAFMVMDIAAPDPKTAWRMNREAGSPNQWGGRAGDMTSRGRKTAGEEGGVQRCAAVIPGPPSML